jgi:hypothetical protein
MKILNKNVYFCDIEGDGLLDTITKIWCLGMAYEKPDDTWDVKVTESKEEIASLLGTECIIVGHNFVDFDIPAIHKVYPDIEVKATIWDSLFFSYGLFDNRLIHGLGSWGTDVGIKKVDVKDGEWIGLTEGELSWLACFKDGDHFLDDFEEEAYHGLLQEKEDHRLLMIDRVTEDCKINTGMFFKFYDRMKELYGDDTDTMYKHIHYLNFLATKASAQQTQVPFSVDIEEARKLLVILEEEKNTSAAIVESAMPKVPIVRTKNRPVKCFKKDLTISKKGQEWFDFLEHCELPRDHTEPVDYISGFKEPSAGSHQQVKAWLYSLGWIPKNYEARYSKVTKITKQVPQIRVVEDDEKVLCPSVRILIKDTPEIKSLERLGLLIHRIGLITGKNGLLVANQGENHEIRQRVGSLANTYRYKHAVLVNIPKQKEYGPEIRKCLTAPKGYKLVSGDVKALEDTTKLISVQPFDPEYVITRSDPYYDAHLDISVQSLLMTQEQSDEYSKIKSLIKAYKKLNLELSPEKHKRISKDEEESFFRLTTLRGLGKRANFSCTYGAYPKKISEIIEQPIAIAEKLWNAYWKINWSIKAFAETLTVKTLSDDSMWLKSELSGFWLSLRSEKDRFSLHNQNMGRFCFDIYTAFVYRLTGYYPIYDQHDDAVYIVPEEKAEWLTGKMKIAIRMMNNKYKLSIPLQIEPAIGDNLSEV